VRGGGGGGCVISGAGWGVSWVVERSGVKESAHGIFVLRIEGHGRTLRCGKAGVVLCLRDEVEWFERG
jgi:hypothetical protein